MKLAYAGVLTLMMIQVFGCALPPASPRSCEPLITRRTWSSPKPLHNGPTVEGIDVAVSANGDAMAVWLERQRSGLAVYASRYTRRIFSSGSWSQPAEVANFSGTQVLGGPAVSMDGHGNALIVWEQPDVSGHSGIYARGFRGGAWGISKRIDDNTSQLQTRPGRPRVAMNDSGEAMVAWTGDIIQGTYNVLVRRQRPNGKWEQITRISDVTQQEAAESLELAIDPKGNAVAVWQAGASSNMSVYAGQFGTTSGWQEPLTLDARRSSPTGMNTGSSSSPYVAAAGRTGGFVVVWSEQMGLAHMVQSARLPIPAGAPVAPVSVGGPGDVGLKANPRVALDGVGNSVIVWILKNSPADIVQTKVRAKSNALVPPANPIELDVRPEAPKQPRVGVDMEGSGVAAWIQSDGTAESAFVRHLVHRSETAQCPELWRWDDSVLQLDRSDLPVIDLDVAVYPSGQAVVVWIAGTGQNTSVFASVYR